MAKYIKVIGWRQWVLRKYFTTVWKFRNLQGFVWKTMQAWLGGKSCFSHTNPSNFRRPLQSLRLKIHRLPNFNMLFQHFKFFQKRTVFVFTVPIIFLSRSLVSSARVLFLTSPHWALILGKPVEEVVTLKKGKCLPSWVAGITVDVIVSVEKYLNCCLNRYILIKKQ